MSATVVNNTSYAAKSTFPKWVNTLLVILIGYALAVVSLKFVTNSNEPFVVRNSNVSVSASQPSIDLKVVSKFIAAQHLFGDAAVPEEVATPEVKQPIRETSLNLTLSGVFAYEPQELSIAIISSGNEESAYRVGDKIVGESTLKEVYSDRVIINNRGKDEVLRLPENSTPISSQRPVAAQVQQRQAQNVASSEPVELPSTPGALRDTLAKNPSMLGRIVAAEPYQENGKLIGYRLTPKQNPEILEAQGIVAGDVITRVNNIELNSQKQGIRALRNAVKAQSLDVTILRDGVEIPLSISLAE